MKLLPRSDIKSKIQKQNDELLIKNSSLRKIHSELLNNINNIKHSNKDEKTKEFEQFCQDITVKKSILLKELKQLQDDIEDKRGIIDALIEKQDVITEKEYQLNEREQKLNLREDFIKGVEHKIYELRK